MAACPKCLKEVDPGFTECPFCGIIFAKANKETSPPMPPTENFKQASPKAKTNPLRGITMGLVLGLTALVVYMWLVWLPDYNRGKNRGYIPPENAGTVKLQDHDTYGFEFYSQLPSGPSGMAWTGEQFIMANRADPWGFFRLTPKSDTKMKLELVPVIEPAYWQKMGFDSVAWNGTTIIGLTSKNWFTQTEGAVFTIHDPETLQVVEWKDAPPHLGALAWDGVNYWAGGRKNTADADEPEGLYKFDAEFNLVETYPAPAPGCQALVYTGGNLLWLDVFTDSAYMIDISGVEPEIMQESRIPFGYPSGGCWDGQYMWLSEYKENRIHRVDPEVLSQWLAGNMILNESSSSLTVDVP